jgi:hypothetical protein
LQFWFLQGRLGDPAWSADVRDDTAISDKWSNARSEERGGTRNLVEGSMAKNRPAHEIRLGRIRAAIWANENGQDDVWFNVTVSRLYNDGDGWKDSSTFRRDDLPVVAKAMDMAYAWIWNSQVTPTPETEEM